MIESNHLVTYDKDGVGIVRAPRPTDAIGTVLRDAFAGRASMPADWSRLLRDLDRTTPQRH